MKMPLKRSHPHFRQLFHLCLIGTLVFWGDRFWTAHADPAMNSHEAALRASLHIGDLANRIRNFHNEVRHILLYAVANPLFVTYFSLDESRSNRYATDKTLQLTQRQTELRKKMERLILKQHKSFPIGETCLVDRHGQEHLRVTNDQVENVENFSDDEASSPFFEPTINLDSGTVNISTPYVSPDIHEWVVAFTSPIVLGTGEHPAFLHMEAPLSFYQYLVSKEDVSFFSGNKIPSNTPDIDEEGRTFIIDQKGFILADSRGKVDFKSKRSNVTSYVPSNLIPENLQDYTTPINSISENPMFRLSVSQILKELTGQKQIRINNRDYAIAFRPVPDRPWILVHIDPVGMPPDALTGWKNN